MTFDADYFQEEVRDGFTISAVMKRAWAAELEVLTVIDQICRSNRIPYFADFGTLLGAVRHQGFIPWDDDIDICLKRDDYMRLLAILPRELPEGFAIAGMYASSERLQNAAKVHQLRIIADETKWNINDYMRYFHGFPYLRIGIDIFPIDYLPRDPELQTLQKEILTFGFLTVQEWERWKEQGTLNDRIQRLEQLCNTKLPTQNTYNSIWKLMDNLSGLYSTEDADEMAEYLFYLEDENYCKKKEWYDETIYLPFENGFQIPAPREYHHILTHYFGDYMKPVRNMADHNYPFYGHMEQELIKQIRAIHFTGTVEEFCHQVAIGEFTI